MAARQASLKSDLLGESLNQIWPITREGQSDTASFDNALELLYQEVIRSTCFNDVDPRSLVEIPIWIKSEDRFTSFMHLLWSLGRSSCYCFYRWKKIGATLDRNGLSQQDISSLTMTLLF